MSKLKQEFDFSQETTCNQNTVTKIKDYEFSGDTSLRSIKLPVGVKYIGSNAFWGCSSLREISLPDGLISIGDSSFEGTALEKVTIPKSVRFLLGNPFAGCNCKLINESPSFVLCDGILYDKYLKVLISCCNYESHIEIPQGVTSIGRSAFYGCSNLEEVILPQTLRYIDEYAFAYCSALKKVVIPNYDKVEIAENAFEQCSFLI